MKVPNSPPPPPPAPDGPLKPAATQRPTEAGPPPSASAAASVSAKVLLAQLRLANQETTLARVAEIINQPGAGASRLLLEIRGQSLTVAASIGETSLATGDWVKVMRAGNELRLLGKLAPAAEATVARALAQRLPWQHSVDAGLARVLTALSGGLKADAGVSAQSPGTALAGAVQPLPVPVRQAIEQLVSLLPTRQALASPVPTGTPVQGPGVDSVTTSAIKQWVEQSGLFAESRLAKATEAPPGDLKLALGRLIHQLLEVQGQSLNGFNRLTPIASPDLIQAPLQFPAATTYRAPQYNAEPVSVGQMLRLLAGVLNRITVNQLHSQVLSSRTTADAPAPNTTLVMDLPWLNQHNEPRVIQLRMEEQARDGDNDRNTRSRDTEWKLSLAMDLDEAGALHFDVALGYGKISAQVWAERQATLQQAQELLPELRKSLGDLGLEVTGLECRRGLPRGATTHLEHRLVDTRA